MVEAVFHIGAHKCATTTIQAGLAALSRMRDNFAYVPQHDPRARPPAEGDEAVRAMVRLVRRGRPGTAAGQSVADGLCRMIERRADVWGSGGPERVVVSDENMLGAMPGIDWSFYPDAATVRWVLDEVAARFPTSVLLQSREPAALLRSCHQFRVRRGMTLSLLGFLERFDLASASWSRLGETLFDGARYRRRVLPIEALADPSRAGEIGAALDFVVPGWSLAGAPLGVANPADSPLMRAAATSFERFGMTLQGARKARIARALAAIEDDLPDLPATEANALLRRTLGPFGLRLPAGGGNLIRRQLDEERRKPGSLHRLLVERFADDYAAFRERYAA